MPEQEPSQADLLARLEAISDAMARMVHRQQRIEARLDAIEQGAHPRPSVPGTSAAPDPPPAASLGGSRQAPPEWDAPVSFPNPIPPEAPPLPPAIPLSSSTPPPLPDSGWESRPPGGDSRAMPAAGSELESRFGLNWLNRVAVVTLILGAGFSFKYAVDNQWIGPAMRVALGIAIGAASLSLGEWLSLRGQKIFARGMTGLGLALLYLAFYASFGFYHLLPQSVAFLLMAATTAAAGGLAHHYNSLPVGILGLLGGYFTPALLSTGENRPWTLFGYLFLMNAGALLMTRANRWRSPAFLAFLGTGLYYAGWASRWFSDDTRLVATVAALAFYAQFAIADSRPLSQLGQVLASLGMFSIWPDPSKAFPLAFGMLLSGMAMAEWRKWLETPLVASAAFWIPAWILWRSREWSERPGLVFIWLTIAFAVQLGWVLWWITGKARKLRSTELWLLAVSGPAYFATSYTLLDDAFHPYMGALAAALAILHALLPKLLWKPGDARDRYPGQLSAALAAVLLTLAIPIQFGGFRVTIAWAIEAAACAWLARKLASERITFGAGILLILVAGRLAYRDAEVSTDGFFNARLLAFFISGAAYLFASYYLKERIAAVLVYGAGHAILLAGLGLEVVSWAERSGADIANTTTTGITILMSIYALGLVGGGVALRSAMNRLLGLALLALVIAKLYLLDVWTLSRGFRITAFLVLGALLLLVSYVYSRFKPMMEKWWKGSALDTGPPVVSGPGNSQADPRHGQF